MKANIIASVVVVCFVVLLLGLSHLSNVYPEVFYQTTKLGILLILSGLLFQAVRSIVKDMEEKNQPND